MVEIRETRPEDRRAAAGTVSMALLQAPPDDEAFEKSQASWDGCDSLSAWDGDTCVGHAGGYRFETIVPGGAWLPTSGVTRVGVLPTARRQGVATTLIRQLLHDSAARGQVLASLRASEAVIYARFGFGIAGCASMISFDPHAATPIRGAAPGSMRLVPPDRILDVVPALYDRVATRPGIIARPDFIWRRYLEDALKLGGDAHLVAVHTDPDGNDDGYVHYSTKWDETPFSPVKGIGEVWDLFGAAPAVELALWAYLCDVDLVGEWRADERPVDEAVVLAVRDHRAYVPKVAAWDEQWLRLLDVDVALRARTYGDCTRAVTIAVSDDLFPKNAGVWSMGSDGASRVDHLDPADADLVADIATLSATYLGGFRWSALAAVGRVQVNDPAALPAADTLFLSPVAPHCGSFF